MPQTIIITLEKELPEAMAVYKKASSGKSLVREADRIESAARRKKVPGFSALLSEDPAALIAQMKEEGFNPEKMRIPPEQWFDAGAGLVTVRGLIEYVDANLNDFKQPNPILKDLRAAEGLLIAAQSAGVRFHFTRFVW